MPQYGPGPQTTNSLELPLGVLIVTLSVSGQELRTCTYVCILIGCFNQRGKEA